MIHYTCDRCKRPIDPAHHSHFVVEIDIQASLDEPCCDADDDIDQLGVLHQSLEGVGGELMEETGGTLCHHGRYDLCSQCRDQLLKNPLGSREPALAIGFSNN